jgi:putative two-component system response regulator
MNSTGTILIVDDDEINLEVLDAMLDALGHKAVRAHSGMEALERLDSDIDLVILDVMMPDLDGWAVVERIRANERFHDIPIIMATASTLVEDRLRAVECGANDFLSKPIDKIELRARALTMLKMKSAQDAVNLYQAGLEEVIDQRTAELRSAIAKVQAANRQIYETQLDTVRRLALAAEHRDEDTASHLQRVAGFCAVIADGLGIAIDEVHMIRHASVLHDVGKIGVPDSVLLKPGPLTPEEFEIVKQHTLIGAKILADSASPLIQAGQAIALSHHEKWDGSGYPKALTAKKIPLYGRICAVADVFDALLSPRPYKLPFSLEATLTIMAEGRGKHFDPDILNIFFDRLEEILKVRDENLDGADRTRRAPALRLSA